MKILVTLTYFTPYISGLTKYAQNLIDGLANRGYQITVLSIRYDDNLKKRESKQGVTIIRAQPICKINKGYLSADWIRQSIKETEKAETIFVNLPGPDAIAAALWAKLRHKKIIAIYHCDVVLANKLSERIIDIVHGLILKMADTIITNTKDYTKTSRVLGKYMNKTEYIYPIITKTVRNKSKKINKPFVIGWVGRMAREKGLEYLFDAVPYLEKELDFRIKIAGPEWTAGEEEYRSKIISLMKKYKERVEIIGQLTDNQLQDFYQRIDVLVLPSVNATETLGMVQLEAMAAGVPVVASNLPGVRLPIIETGKGILVEPKNSKELAEAIIKIYNTLEKFTGNIPTIFDPEIGLDKYEHLLLS